VDLKLITLMIVQQNHLYKTLYLFGLDIWIPYWQIHYAN